MTKLIKTAFVAASILCVLAFIPCALASAAITEPEITAEGVVEGSSLPSRDEAAESREHEVYNEMTVQLICSNADLMNVESLKEALDEQRSIKAVYERSFTNGVAVIDVELLGDADFLSRLLVEMKNAPLVNVTAKTQGRIDLKFVE